MSLFCHFTLVLGLEPYTWSERHYFTQNLAVTDDNANKWALDYVRYRAALLGIDVAALYCELGDDMFPQSTKWADAGPILINTSPQVPQPPSGGGLNLPFFPGFPNRFPGFPSTPSVPNLNFQGTIKPPQNKPVHIQGAEDISGAAVAARVIAGLGSGGTDPTTPVPTPTLDSLAAADAVTAGANQVLGTSDKNFAPPPDGQAYNPAFNGLANVPSTPDFPYANVLVRKEAAVNDVVYQASTYLAGNPDYVQRPNITVPVDPDWLAAWKLFVQFLTQSGRYGMKVKFRGGAQSPIEAVENITVDAGNHFVLHTIQAVPWPAGAQIQVSKVKGTIPSQISGERFILARPDANTIVLAQPLAPPGWQVLFGGYVQLTSFTVVPYSNLLLRKFTHRKRGVTQAGVRGRKRTKRSTST